jgi:hypothetical protein
VRVVLRFSVVMLPPFDIFRVEAHCEVVWVKSAADLKSARLAVKALIKSSPGEYLIHSHSTHHALVVKPSPAKKQRAKPVIFQIAYDGRLIASRAELLKANGFAVVSVLGNGAAKFALAKPQAQDYALFIVGHGATLKVRKEMADWLKEKYPKVEILALTPPHEQRLATADYNVVLNGPEEWLFVVEASTA